jgi:hypothetical protein
MSNPIYKIRIKKGDMVMVRSGKLKAKLARFLLLTQALIKLPLKALT